METKKTAIYHFTDGSKKRPYVYKKQLQRLEEYAHFLGYADTEIFCDMSLLRCERPEFDRFLARASDFGALVTKDFYHISKNTMKCMDIMKELRRKGVKVHTMENGSFSWKDPPFCTPLIAATYCCHFGAENELKEIIPVQNDILKLFISKKTNWILANQYYDISEHQNNDEQVQLMELIENKGRYDILLVHNMNNVHWRTANFCKIREKLQLDIYSLQDGFLQYIGGQT